MQVINLTKNQNKNESKKEIRVIQFMKPDTFPNRWVILTNEANVADNGITVETLKSNQMETDTRHLYKYFEVLQIDKVRENITPEHRKIFLISSIDCDDIIVANGSTFAQSFTPSASCVILYDPTTWMNHNYDYKLDEIVPYDKIFKYGLENKSNECLDYVFARKYALTQEQARNYILNYEATAETILRNMYASDLDNLMRTDDEFISYLLDDNVLYDIAKERCPNTKIPFFKIARHFLNIFFS